jgi:hypothetical protein
MKRTAETRFLILKERLNIMLKKLVLGLALLSFTGPLLAADAFTGTWKLNVAKSKLAPGTEVKDLTVVIAEQGENLVVTVKGTGGDGTPVSVKYAVPMKGGAVSYSEGAPKTGATATTKRVNATTIDSTSSVGGKEVGSTHSVVSADGKTLTRMVKGMDAQGKPYQNTEVYEKQ